jgi:hypothetical protein
VTMVWSLTRMLVSSLVSHTVLAAVAYAGLRLLDAPLAGVLAAVTGLTAFVPIGGAWPAGVPVCRTPPSSGGMRPVDLWAPRGRAIPAPPACPRAPALRLRAG